MDDLVQWLRAQLDKDVRIAREAGGAAWEELLVSGWVHTSPLPDTEWLPPGYDHHVASAPLPADRAHIVAHDPSRVLREIDADRELLAEYGRLLDAHAAHQREADRLAEAGDDADVIQVAALRREADYLPAMLHVLERWAKRKAAVYVDRPGYREEWRP